jgi:hypothetical protein
MSKLRRAYLISLFVFLFFIVGVSAFLYSQGWRFDIKTFHAAKVGAIYLRTFPKDASIQFDGKPMKNASWLLQTGTFFNNLFPKEYDVHITRDGYLGWNRTILVAPSYVAEIKYAVLAPDERAAVSVPLQGGSRIWRAGRSGNFIVQDARGLLSYGQYKLPGDTVWAQSQDLSNVVTYDSASSVYYLFATATASSTNLSALARKHGMDGELGFAFNSSDNNELIVASANAIGRYSASDNSLVLINDSAEIAGKNLIRSLSSSHSLISFAEFDPDRNISRLMVFDNFLDRFSADDISVPGKTLQTTFTKNDQLALLQDDGRLYLYSLSDNTKVELANDAVSFTATPDGNRFAILEQNSLEVYSLQDTADYRRFRLSSSGGIARLEWYMDGQHLFLHYPDNVSFLDVDDIRLEDVKAVSKDPNAVYNGKNNVLYEVQKGVIRELKFPE